MRPLVLVVLVGCGGGGTPPVLPLPQPAQAALEDARWGKFHSVRHALTLPLPDGHAWKIDDHTRYELQAAHAPTNSKVTVRLIQDAGDLMNRAKCEQKALDEKFVKDLRVSVVEEQEGIDKDGWDMHVLVAVEKTPTDLVGHVTSFSSFIRKCLWFHFETHVKDGGEVELSDRLALAKTKILDHVELDMFANVPRAHP